MNCERCGNHPGEIRYTEVSAGEQRRVMICAACAEELGFGAEEETAGHLAPVTPEPADTGGAVVFASAGVPADAELLRLRCPGCGIRGAELRHASLLGCPRCYETFARWLDPVLQRLHGASRHRGRVPGGSTPPETPPGREPGEGPL